MPVTPINGHPRPETCAAILAKAVLLSSLCFSVASACARTEVPQASDLTLPDGKVIRQARVTEDTEGEKKIYLAYATSVSTEDCAAIQAEVRRVWDLYFRAEAEQRGATTAFIFPEYTRPDGWVDSPIFFWTLEKNEAWKEDGNLKSPCGTDG